MLNWIKAKLRVWLAVQVLLVEPGDVLVLDVPAGLPLGKFNRIAEELGKVTNHRVLVLSEGVKLSALPQGQEVA